MFEKKKFLLNCEVCDTRKIKEEDYSGYELMMINADVVLVNETSKSVLNHLPLTMNQDSMIAIPEDMEVAIKVVNADYRISGSVAVQEHTVLIVNGPLEIEPGTEELLKKHEHIIVNGPVTYPKSCEGLLNKMVVNGPTTVYPDDCVVMDAEFTIDKYFPLRAREGSRYFAKNTVIIKDDNVDVTKLAAKKVQFITEKLVILESKLEDALSMFDEHTELVVVPEGMKLVYGDSVLNEELICKEGKKLFVYGDLQVAENVDAAALSEMLEKLMVKGSLKLKKEQEEAFRKLGAEYDKLIFIKNCRCMTNKLKVKLDKLLFDNSPEGIEVMNVAKVTIAEDVTPEMILEKLRISNCAKVSCNELQESAVAAIADNVAKIGSDSEGEDIMGDVLGNLKGLTETKMINAETYVM